MARPADFAGGLVVPECCHRELQRHQQHLALTGRHCLPEYRGCCHGGTPLGMPGDRRGHGSYFGLPSTLCLLPCTMAVQGVRGSERSPAYSVEDCLSDAISLLAEASEIDDNRRRLWRLPGVAVWLKESSHYRVDCDDDLARRTPHERSTLPSPLHQWPSRKRLEGGSRFGVLPQDMRAHRGPGLAE
jgi:hypothetical protein